MSDSGQNVRVIRFANFVLHLDSGELFKGGRKIRLQGQPFQLLSVLVERRAELVTRGELREAIWPKGTVVDFDRGLNRAIKKVRDALRDSAVKPRYIETLPRRGYRFIGAVEGKSNLETQTGKSPGGIPSIGVMPFAVADGVAETEYLAEGISEAITNRLSSLTNLLVVPRTTMVRFEGKHMSAQRIGREAKIQHLLTGTVARAADHLKVQAELVRTSEGRQLWGKQYRRSLDCIGDIETELAAEIAGSLQMRLSEEDNRRLGQRQTTNAEAYRLYLQGAYFWNRRSPQRALECFDLATEKDPAFALAWAGLGNAYTLYFAFQMLPPAEAAGKIKESVENALRIDPSTANAHACLGFVNSFHDWDWEKGEHHFRKAIELDPTLGTAQAWFAHALSSRGRNDESVIVLKRALDSEPASPTLNAVAAQTLLQIGLYEDAISVCEKALDFDSNSALVSWVFGAAYALTGNYDQAIVFLRRSIAQMPAHKVPVTPVLTWLGYAHARSGNRDEAKDILATLRSGRTRGYVSPYNFALISFGLEDRDEGFKHLEEAWQDHSFWLAFFAPLTARLSESEGDSRMKGLLHRMNLR